MGRGARVAASLLRRLAGPSRFTTQALVGAPGYASVRSFTNGRSGVMAGVGQRRSCCCSIAPFSCRSDQRHAAGVRLGVAAWSMPIPLAASGLRHISLQALAPSDK